MDLTNKQNLNNFISKDSIRRLIKDVSEIRKNPLTSNGIYYHHDEEDMLKGYAMIIGSHDTPYYRGYYLFEFIFPTDYPYSPPKLNYKTNGENIRFNPNLYVNEKVCISILNTWHGDPWSSCQTISSILLTLCSVLNKNPLLNEPGVNEHHPELEKYNKIIRFSNISIAICKMIEKEFLFTKLKLHFFHIAKKHFLENYENLLKDVEYYIEKNPISEYLHTGFYNLNVEIDYLSLKEKIIKCKTKLNSEENIFINKIEI